MENDGQTGSIQYTEPDPIDQFLSSLPEQELTGLALAARAGARKTLEEAGFAQRKALTIDEAYELLYRSTFLTIATVLAVR